MAFKNPQTTEEMGKFYEGIKDKFIETSRNSRYPNDDHRTLFFKSCGSWINVILSVFNIFLAYERGETKDGDFEKLIGLRKGTVQSYSEKMGKFLRVSIVTMFQFQTENFLVNLLSKLKPAESLPRGYSKIVSGLLEKITIRDKKKVSDILHILQHLRNSLHANGIHNNDDFAVTLQEFEFKFVKGKEVNCAGFGPVGLAMIHTCHAMEEIIESPEIKAISEKIPMQYLEK